MALSDDCWANFCLEALALEACFAFEGFEGARQRL